MLALPSSISKILRSGNDKAIMNVGIGDSVLFELIPHLPESIRCDERYIRLVSVGRVSELQWYVN